MLTGESIEQRIPAGIARGRVDRRAEFQSTEFASRTDFAPAFTLPGFARVLGGIDELRQSAGRAKAIPVQHSLVTAAASQFHIQSL